MIVCKNCGVELEESMGYCPLCGLPANSVGDFTEAQSHPQSLYHRQQMTAPQKKFTWEIISLVLLSAIAATFIIDFILNREVSWSEYPAAISFTIFSYVSLFAFWQQKIVVQMLAGFIVSSVCMTVIDLVTGGIQWAFNLAIPILLAMNLLVVGFIMVLQLSKYKGVNLLAWGFLAAALLCMCIDGVLSYHQVRSLELGWSIIVGGCAVPVVLVLIFIHFRLKKGRNLKRTFHM
jgi:hypothetical protein